MVSDVAVLRNDPGLADHLQNSSFTRIFLWDIFAENTLALFPRFKTVCNGLGQIRDVDYFPEAFKPFMSSDRHYPTRPKKIY